jgi:hypothetical protein
VLQHSSHPAASLRGLERSLSPFGPTPYRSLPRTVVTLSHIEIVLLLRVRRSLEPGCVAANHDSRRLAPAIGPNNLVQASKVDRLDAITLRGVRTYLWQTECFNNNKSSCLILIQTLLYFLTKNGPLKTRIRGLTSIKKVKLLTHLKFENRLRMLHPQGL